MTREEAKEWKIIDTSNGITYSLEKLIDKIYDDFESRTCDGCKYCKYIEDGFSTKYKCYFGIGEINEYGIIFTKQDFGCNKWEAKEN